MPENTPKNAFPIAAPDRWPTDEITADLNGLAAMKNSVLFAVVVAVIPFYCVKFATSNKDYKTF